ncbi:MmgE/PrpD family protein [Candidatus Binatus sp.]|uniref:MmgE/PrpD family protein n=1 Tax=Candidatus Binatus sp. TaxID=2811406 RepID=UPI003BE2CFE6
MSTSETQENFAFAATLGLVRAVRAMRWEQAPEDAREVARHCILDFLGVAVAGSREPLTEILVNEIVKPEGSSQAGLIGRMQRASRLSAALVNGAAAHALDFDDTHTAMGGHPSVPVIPAVLALADSAGLSGREVLEALLIGIELECRLGALIGAQHYAIGFHSTGTVGTFGAAAACAHLLRLDEDGWLRALGLAGTQAAGLKSGFGTMAKPLHAGRAASNGLFSALAARGGYTSNPEIIETAQGFAATHAGAKPSREVLDRFAGRFLIRETLFKYHASCYLTHAPINAAQQIRAEHRVDPKSIDEVEVRVHPALFGVCNIQEPKTGLEGKFSLRATTAMALLGEDTSNLETFTDAKVTEARVVSLRDRIRIVRDEKTPSTRATVVVKSNGRIFEIESDSGQPASDLLAQREKLTRKFMALTAPILGRRDADALASAALNADQLASASKLIDLTQAS